MESPHLQSLSSFGAKAEALPVLPANSSKFFCFGPRGVTSVKAGATFSRVAPVVSGKFFSTSGKILSTSRFTCSESLDGLAESSLQQTYAGVIQRVNQPRPKEMDRRFADGKPRAR